MKKVYSHRLRFLRSDTYRPHNFFDDSFLPWFLERYPIWIAGVFLGIVGYQIIQSL